MLSALLHLILQHLSLKIFKSKSAKWKSAQQFKTNFSCLIIFRHTEEGWLHKVSSIEKMPLNCQSCVFQRDFHYTVKACPLVSQRIYSAKNRYSLIFTTNSFDYIFITDFWYFVHSFQKEHLLARALVICFIWNFWESKGWKLVTVIPITT